MERLQQLVERDQWAELLTDAQDLYKQSKNSEIEILAFSKKEAEKKAMEVFNIPIEYLDFSLVRKGESSFFNIIKNPSYYLCSVKEEYKTLFLHNIDYEEHNILASNKDGSFRLLMRKKGLVLQIFKPKGIGKIVTLEQIKEELLRREFNNINQELIKQALTTYDPIIIAPYTRIENNNSTFHITLSKDLMEATFIFIPPIDKGCIPDPADIITELENQNIIHGINSKRIAEALDNELYNIPIVIAEGTPAINGTSAYIEYTFPTGNDVLKYAVRSDGSVNFKELNIIHNVFENSVLAIMYPATQGISGTTITGDTILAQDGVMVEWDIGSNVHLSDNKLEALASISGQVYLKNKQICVDLALEIPSDVDLSVGNIDFLGNVIIKGGIADGFSVISGGNIEVYGHIGKCFMHAEGNIIAHQGIQGKDEATIECKGNLFAHFIERTAISTGGNLIVAESLLHSHVISAKGIYVTGGKKSIIAGGDIKAQYEIVATKIGAESYVETHVEVGYSKILINKNKQLFNTISTLDTQIKDYNTQLTMLGTEHPKTTSIYRNLQLLQKQKDTAEESLEQNQKTLHQRSSEASISASKSFMPGVKVKIGATKLDITAEQSSGTLKQDRNRQIMMNSYSPSAFMLELAAQASENKGTSNRRRR